MLDIKDFGGRLAYLRHKIGYRQSDIAKLCGVSSQAVSKWENGMTCPDILILDDLASALKVEIQDLFFVNDPLQKRSF